MTLPWKYFRFGQLRQERGEKHVQSGSLVSAINVHQTDKAGVYQKRRGFDMTSLLFSGATWGAATPVSCVTAKDGAGILMRDSQNRLWSYDGAAVSPTWKYKGTQTRYWNENKLASGLAYSNPQLCTVEVGANTWTFAKRGNISISGLTHSVYDLIITLTSTGETLYRYESIVADGGSASPSIDTGLRNWCACYDGTYVWMFYVALGGYSDNKVWCHKFTAASPSTTPTETTYYTAAGPMNHVACFVHATAGVIVAFCGLYAGTARLYHSLLDQATGAAKVSPAPQLIVNASTSLPIQALGFHSEQSPSASTIYYHYHGFQTGGSGATYSGPTTVAITNLSTLASSVTRHTSEVGSTTEIVVASGIAIDGVDTAVMWSRDGGYLALTRTASATWKGWTDSYAGCWLASGLKKSGTDVYFLTGHDDVGDSSLATGTAVLSESYSTQRAFHLRKFSIADLTAAIGAYNIAPVPSWGWSIVAQSSAGSAGARYHNAKSTPLAMYRTGTTQTLSVCRIPDTQVSGTKVLVSAAAYAGVTGAVGVHVLTFDTNKSFGKDAQLQGKAIGPGNIPVVWGKDDVAHEISPLLAPAYIRASGVTGTDYQSIAVVYRIQDADGTVYRSAPFVLGLTFGVGTSISIPYLRHSLPGTTANIEVYVGKTATPKLQTILPASGQIASGGAYLHEVSYGTPALADYVEGEDLYTIGGGLSQSWPPQCQAVGYWKNRVFLAGGNVLWYSHESEDGFGPLFNEVMRSIWGESSSEINVIQPTDWNYLALLASDKIGVVDGPGPDSLGSGAYIIKTLSSMAGASLSTRALTGQGGCYFQDDNTGRLMAVTPQLQVVECAGGAYDYSSQTVIAACQREASRLLLFLTSTGTVIAIDYQHPTEAAPLGQVYIWTLSVAPYAAGDDASGIYYIGSAGELYRVGSAYRDTLANGTATDYRMLIKSAPLQIGDLQGEFDASQVQVLGKFRANCSIKLTTFPDYASVGNATNSLAFTAEPLQLMTRPPNCMRIQALSLQVEETTGTGAAFDFEGFAIQYLARGRAKGLNTSQVVA